MPHTLPHPRRGSILGPVVVLGALGALGAHAAVTATASPPPAAHTTNRWDTEQRSNAATIVTVGKELGVPRRARIVALATAMQESNLRNDSCCDHDSLGLFQQRPSQGWGTPAQVKDPRYAARAFYRKLLAVPGWQWMPVTMAAQAVQASAYPYAYAKWTGDADALAG